MKGFRCWSAESVRQTIYSDIGALSGDADAVFLAAHTPTVLRQLRGPEVSTGDLGEQRVHDTLLEAVGRDVDRNTLIAITGAPGSGKSHIVRWVHAHVDPADDRFHVVYVPRAVQTIRQLLRHLVAGLPEAGGEDFLRRLDEAVGNVPPQLMRERLFNETMLALKWALDVQPPQGVEDEDAIHIREERDLLLGELGEDGQRAGGLGDLLGVPQIARRLLRDGGRLHRLVESWSAETSRRGDAEDPFTAEDLPFRESGVRTALASEPNLLDLWGNVRDMPEAALALLDEALPHAARTVLGLRTHGAETLNSLFERSRRALRTNGKELVLLFEDLAQFGLVEGELYDQFATPPGADLAPLRVIFAITNDPFHKLPLTVSTRISHQFEVASAALTDRHAFLARYLNLARVGREDVEQDWRNRRPFVPWVRNACHTREDGAPCRFRESCHRDFGRVNIDGLGDVGLYPYNETALRRILEQQGQDATPRHLMDVVLTDTLIEADAHIGRGTFPHARMRERADFRVSQAPATLLGGRAGPEAERAYTALVMWGDEEPLPPAVVEAFALAGLVGSPTSAPVPLPPGLPGTSRVEKLPSQPVTVESPLLPLWQWQNGGNLPDHEADAYRDLLARLVAGRLNLDQHLVHTYSGRGQELLNRRLGRTTFGIEGTRGEGLGSRFTLTRQPEDVTVLAAARWYYDHSHWVAALGNWPWPQGYTEAQLMLALEVRLDKWADEIRNVVLADTLNGKMACAAVGVRAVALMARGHGLAAVDVTAVLGAPPERAEPSTAAWTAVDAAALDVLRRVNAAELAGAFAAVRQGRGGAQLVDAAALEASIKDALDRPDAYLREAERDLGEVAPDVASAARDLADALQAAASNAVKELSSATALVSELLEGAPPSAVAAAALEAGKRALDSSLFRPADGWATFSAAVERLETLPDTLPKQWAPAAAPVDALVAAQAWSRHMCAAASVLTTLRDALDRTRAECERVGGAIGGLAQEREKVATRLQAVQQTVSALADGSEG